MHTRANTIMMHRKYDKNTMRFCCRRDWYTLLYHVPYRRVMQELITHRRRLLVQKCDVDYQCFHCMAIPLCSCITGRSPCHVTTPRGVTVSRC